MIYQYKLADSLSQWWNEGEGPLCAVLSDGVKASCKFPLVLDGAVWRRNFTVSDTESELISTLQLAEAALADIGDAEREPGDDIIWAEKRAGEVLPKIRHVLNSVRVVPNSEIENPLQNTTKDLYAKYVILRKKDDTPVQYPCFVLRIDGTDPIAMEALRTYALKCDEPLASSLLKHIEDTPIKLTSQQIIGKAAYILNTCVEGVSDDEYDILQELLELAKEGLKKDD